MLYFCPIEIPYFTRYANVGLTGQLGRAATAFPLALFGHADHISDWTNCATSAAAAEEGADILFHGMVRDTRIRIVPIQFECPWCRRSFHPFALHMNRRKSDTLVDLGADYQTATNTFQ